MEKVKTGECYYRDEAGALFLAISYADAEGNTSTEHIEVEPAPVPEAQ